MLVIPIDGGKGLTLSLRSPRLHIEFKASLGYITGTFVSEEMWYGGAVKWHTHRK